MKLDSVHLAGQPSHTLWDVSIAGGFVQAINAAPDAVPGAAHPVLLPSLCHPHVHLDKAFIFSSNDSRYQDLIPVSGTFQEALQNTTKAKERYDPSDLFLRGSQLIAESIQAGVTAMRAFVEIDHTVGTKCLETAIQLKKKFASSTHVQIVAFAQDPISSGPHAQANKTLMERALHDKWVDVLGTTPYVESDHESAVRNIEWAVDLALERQVHLDFHLDYNTDQYTEPTIWDVIRVLALRKWTSRTNKKVVLGHCTTLTLFSDQEMTRLATSIQEARLPISFVGLPTSDLYMMGRPDQGWGGQRPRATLQIPDFIETFGLNAAIGINNVGNAFTPWGSCDPLSLACLGVGLYQAGSVDDVSLLYECVSTRAKRAIGVDNEGGVSVRRGDLADFVLFDSGGVIRVGEVEVPGRLKRTVRDVVWDPPPVEKRRVIRMSNQTS